MHRYTVLQRKLIKMSHAYFFRAHNPDSKMIATMIRLGEKAIRLTSRWDYIKVLDSGYWKLDSMHSEFATNKLSNEYCIAYLFPDIDFD